MPRRALAPALFLVTLALVGCSTDSDKAGGSAAPKTLVLRLAIGTDSSEVRGFANEVARLSGGSVEIVRVGDWRLGQRDFERGLIADVRSGKTDLGAVASRAWDSVGVRSFRALGAPLLIDSYALQQRVLASSIGRRMLEGLHPIGLVGLGVLPGALRRPLGARRPLLAPSDYAGLRVRLQPSRVASAAFRALGATPAPTAKELPVAGLDGAESHVAAIQGNHHGGSGYLTTNVVLWARPLVIFASRQTLARLDPRVRDLLERAAAADIPRETRFLVSYEAIDAALLCLRRQPRFVAASPADVTALRRALQPLYAELERDAQTRRDIAAIERQRRQLGAPTSVVPGCSPVPPTATASAAPPTTIDGSYEATVRPADLQATNRVAEQYGKWRIVLDRGRFRLSEDSHGADWFASGTFRVRGATLALRFALALDWGPHGAPNGVPVAGGDTVLFGWRQSGRSLALSLRRGALVGLAARPLRWVAEAPSRQPPQDPAVLEGTWTSQPTAADVAPLDPGAVESSTGPLRLTIHSSRCRWTQQAPDGFHWGVGSCRFAGDTLEFAQTRTDEGKGGPNGQLYLRWSVFHGRLTFETTAGASPYVWTLHAWRRVG